MTIPKHLMEAKICNKDTCEEIRRLKDCCTDAYETGQEIINDLEKENQRLNNVLSKFEKWLRVNLTNLEKENANNTYDKGLKRGMYVVGRLIENKLKEFKESDK